MSDDQTPARDGAATACPGCGAPTVEGAAFCHQCGHPLGASAPAAAATAEAETAAPSPFDAPPAEAPTAPPPPPGTPPRGTTLPGYGAPARPPPGQPHVAGTPPAGASPHPAAAPAPPGRGRAGPVVPVGAGGAVVLVAVVGILAAIAVPNLIRHQLRAREAEVGAVLAALDRAEQARKAAGQDYVVFAEGLPAGQRPGRQQLAWSEEDRALASALDWRPGEATEARFAVDGQEDEEGNQAIAICAEMDLDEDGELAAWAVFRPALAPDGSLLVPPPPAPCAGAVELREGASLEFDPAVPPGTPVRLSPDGVF